MSTGGVGGRSRIEETRSEDVRAIEADAAGVPAPTLGVGSRGAPVAEIQELLNAAKLPGIQVATDGIFGRQTERAVAAFQKAHALPATGFVDDCTLERLRKATGPGAGPGTRPAPAAGGALPRENLVESYKLGAEGEDGLYGTLKARIGGRERVLDQSAGSVFERAKTDRYLVWDGGPSSGTGGFENEGEALRLYDAKTGEVRDVLLEDVMIDDAKSVKLPNGREALLVDMSDGGLGASYVAVVDPERGEVARFEHATAGKLKDGKLTIEHRDYENADDASKARITRREEVDLQKLIEGPVLVRPMEFWDTPEIAAEALQAKSPLRVASAMQGLRGLFAPDRSTSEDVALFNETIRTLRDSGALTGLAKMVRSGALPGGAGDAWSTLIGRHATPEMKRAWDQACVEANQP